MSAVGAATSSAPERPRRRVTRLHTLGPTGTNCERAAHHWFRRRDEEGEVVLHPTLEAAAEVLASDEDAALLACVVYPALHELVFENLDWLELVDCFVLETDNMLLARRPGGSEPGTVASHPAPAGLSGVPHERIRLVSSNAQAAADCSAGVTDACITTLTAARRFGLRVVRDFGPVPMGFTIHARTDEEDER